MQMLSMERVDELDTVCGEEVRTFLHSVLLSTFFHEDNVDWLKRLAKGAGVAPEEFSSYAWLRAYVAELNRSFEDLPSLENVAQQFGIDPEELESYLCKCDELHHDEWGDHLEDLQADAEVSLQGD